MKIKDIINESWRDRSPGSDRWNDVLHDIWQNEYFTFAYDSYESLISYIEDKQLADEYTEYFNVYKGDKVDADTHKYLENFTNSVIEDAEANPNNLQNIIINGLENLKKELQEINNENEIYSDMFDIQDAHEEEIRDSLSD